MNADQRYENESGSRERQPRGFMSKQDNDEELSSSEEEMEVPADPALLQRISQVEQNLLQVEDQMRRVSIVMNELTIPTTNMPEMKEDMPAILKPHAYPCPDTYKPLPASPTKWPQAPLMLRPTPGAKMTIRGIRFADSIDYQNFPGTCAGCCLPINTGKEKPGKSLVIDFESSLFIGTILLRIRNVPAIKSQLVPSDEETTGAVYDYFAGKKRMFQVIVAGKFKRSVPINDCMTGQLFDRPAGHLPPKLIVSTFISLISRLAPQLQVGLSGDRPRFLSPLVATAHTVLVKDQPNDNLNYDDVSSDDDGGGGASNERLRNWSIYKGSSDMEAALVEPKPCDLSSIMQALQEGATRNTSRSAWETETGRRTIRKKAFNNLAVQLQNAPADIQEEPMFETEKEYTFEFYQHMLVLSDENDIKLSVAHAKVGLAKALNGQPIKILACRKHPSATAGGGGGGGDDNMTIEPLWSFDIWHQSLYPLAKAVLSGKTSG